MISLISEVQGCSRSCMCEIEAMTHKPPFAIHHSITNHHSQVGMPIIPIKSLSHITSHSAPTKPTCQTETPHVAAANQCTRTASTPTTPRRKNWCSRPSKTPRRWPGSLPASGKWISPSRRSFIRLLKSLKGVRWIILRRSGRWRRNMGFVRLFLLLAGTLLSVS